MVRANPPFLQFWKGDKAGRRVGGIGHMSSFQICMLLNNFPDLRPKHLIRNNNLNLYITGQRVNYSDTHYYQHLSDIYNTYIKSGILPSSAQATDKPQLCWVRLISSLSSHPPTSTKKIVWYNLLFFMFSKLHQIHMICHSFLKVGRGSRKDHLVTLERCHF